MPAEFKRLTYRGLSGVVISYVLFPVHVGFLHTYFFYLSPEKGTPALLCYRHFFVVAQNRRNLTAE
jgi:hypothetical protein